MIDKQKVGTLLELGLAGVHLGRPAESRAIFEGLLAYDPSLEATARIGLALTHLVVDDFEPAESLFQSVLATWPDSQEARVLLGLTYKLSKRPEQAAALLNQAAGEGGPAADLAQALAAWPN